VPECKTAVFDNMYSSIVRTAMADDIQHALKFRRPAPVRTVEEPPSNATHDLDRIGGFARTKSDFHVFEMFR
jgi:hypothetical protein